MRLRCNNPNATHYEYYGAKGIRVAAAWDSYEAFLNDMGPAPQGASIDRIDNSRGYEPGNCRWATKAAQALNRSSTRFLTLNGETLHMKAWEERLGLSSGAITHRLNRGWHLEEALTLPKTAAHV
jgi:hypothetical protein